MYRRIAIVLLVCGCSSQRPADRPGGPTTTIPPGPCADQDSDGVCDTDDACPGFDDAADSDGDGTADGCDLCQGHDDADDGDGDTVPDRCDLCEGADDLLDPDEDGDSVVDACDVCPAADDRRDHDGDGVPDGCDVCALGDDAADSDGDGTPDACDDCPTTTSEGACGDGVDDDCDGLLDCEDADCVEDPGCVELACANVTDDDHDGLIDCEDPDCQLTAVSCMPHGVTVLGGRMELTDHALGGGLFTTSWSRTVRVELYDVFGEVRVRSSAGATMSTCAWSFTRGGFAHQSHGWSGPVSSASSSSLWSTGSSSALTPIRRSGFRIQPGCALQTSGFLPAAFLVRHDAAHLAGPLRGQHYVTGDRWYDGPVVDQSTFSDHAYDVGWRTRWVTKDPVTAPH